MSSPAAAIQRMIRKYTGLSAPVHILCIGSFINRAGSFAFVFLTIYVSEQLGFGITFATQCFGVFGLGSIVASLVGGQLADRYGRRSIMLIALFGGAIILVVLGVVRSQLAFVTLVLLFALTMDHSW
jgi:predicted MFS family arabinose efflux permease